MEISDPLWRPRIRTPQYMHLWDAVFVIDLPQVPVFLTGGLPELKCGHKGIFIRQTLRQDISTTQETKRALVKN